MPLTRVVRGLWPSVDPLSPAKRQVDQQDPPSADAPERRSEEKREKVTLIPGTHAGVDPRAVVVHLERAGVADPAVVRSRRHDTLTLVAIESHACAGLGSVRPPSPSWPPRAERHGPPKEIENALRLRRVAWPSQYSEIFSKVKVI